MLPLATTTISIKRPSVGTDIDPWVSGDDSADTTVATGIGAHISTPSGFERAVGGSMENVTFHLNAEVCDLTNTDRVYDERSGLTYEVVWVEPRSGLGLDHMTAELRKIVGAAP